MTDDTRAAEFEAFKTEQLAKVREMAARLPDNLVEHVEGTLNFYEHTTGIAALQEAAAMSSYGAAHILLAVALARQADGHIPEDAKGKRLARTMGAFL